MVNLQSTECNHYSIEVDLYITDGNFVTCWNSNESWIQNDKEIFGGQNLVQFVHIQLGVKALSEGQPFDRF